MRSVIPFERCGSPSSVIDPLSGAMMLRIIRIVVVLPAPFGPSRPYTLPVGTASDRSLHGDVLVVALDDVSNVDCEV